MEQMDSDPADAIRPLLSHLLRPRGSHDASGSSSESAMASVMGKVLRFFFGSLPVNQDSMTSLFVGLAARTLWSMACLSSTSTFTNSSVPKKHSVSSPKMPPSTL